MDINSIIQILTEKMKNVLKKVSGFEIDLKQIDIDLRELKNDFIRFDADSLGNIKLYENRLQDFIKNIDEKIKMIQDKIKEADIRFNEGDKQFVSVNSMLQELGRILKENLEKSDKIGEITTNMVRYDERINTLFKETEKLKAEKKEGFDTKSKIITILLTVVSLGVAITSVIITFVRGAK